MAIKKIARNAYRKAPKTTLYSYAANVYKRMKDVPAYAPLQAQVEALAIPMLVFANALAAAHNKGIAEILAKNETAKLLIGGLDIVAQDLEVLAAGRVQMIVEAGFSVQEETNRFSGILPAPKIVRISGTGKKGQVRISLSNEFPRAVRMHAIEYSLDQGATWVAGDYNSFRSFIVSGLPHAPDMWVRVRSLGNGANKSEWSEYAVVAVA